MSDLDVRIPCGVRRAVGCRSGAACVPGSEGPLAPRLRRAPRRLALAAVATFLVVVIGTVVVVGVTRGRDHLVQVTGGPSRRGGRRCPRAPPMDAHRRRLRGPAGVSGLGRRAEAEPAGHGCGVRSGDGQLGQAARRAHRGPIRACVRMDGHRVDHLLRNVWPRGNARCCVRSRAGHLATDRTRPGGQGHLGRSGVDRHRDDRDRWAIDRVTCGVLADDRHVDTAPAATSVSRFEPERDMDR